MLIALFVVFDIEINGPIRPGTIDPTPAGIKITFEPLDKPITGENIFKSPLAPLTIETKEPDFVTTATLATATPAMLEKLPVI